MKYKIPISQPYLTQQDFRELKKCFDSSWISSKSPWIEKLEDEFSKRISGTRYAVAVNSGTSALFLALKALGVGRGDEVILPTFTMIATVNAVVWAGATPVLVDSISTLDWNIDPNEIESKITKKTKAIIPVHIYGYMCKMGELKNLADKYGLFVIEDAAEAMGATLNNKQAGSFGDMGCFSLYSNKVITAGNGGVITTNSLELVEKLRRLRFFDFNMDDHFVHSLVGYNLVLSGLQAAVGYSQAKRFEKMLAKRKQIFNWYEDDLNGSGLSFAQEEKKTKASYWLPAVVFKSSSLKDKAIAKLEAKGVEIRNFFLPVHKQPVYARLFKDLKFEVVDDFYNKGLLLPSYFQMRRQDVEMVCSLIISIL